MNKTSINGIDVAGCRFFWSGTDTKCHMGLNYSDSIECGEIHNCYFKQLKRLQEENEELKKYQYTQEYLQSEIEKRQKALEEIREIAKYNQFYNPKYFMLRGDIGQVQNIRMTEIYEKINEVLK